MESGDGEAVELFMTLWKAMSTEERRRAFARLLEDAMERQKDGDVSDIIVTEVD